MIDIVDGKFVFSKDIRGVKEVSDVLDGEFSAEEIDKICTFVYHFLNSSSSYNSILPSERKMAILNDYGIKEDLIYNEKVINLLSKYEKMVLSPSRVYYEGIKEKIEQYLQLFKNTPITISNHEEIAKTIKISKELLLLQKELEKQFINEDNSRNVGGLKISLFEDGEGS